jgi:hypothetical protein
MDGYFTINDAKKVVEKLLFQNAKDFFRLEIPEVQSMNSLR